MINVITKFKYITDKSAVYALVIDDNMTAEYRINYKKKETSITIYSEGYSEWYNEATYDSVQFSIPVSLPFDEQEPLKSIQRFNKLLVLK